MDSFKSKCQFIYIKMCNVDLINKYASKREFHNP